MIETAENLAADFGIGRGRADVYAARSHQRGRRGLERRSASPARWSR